MALLNVVILKLTTMFVFYCIFTLIFSTSFHIITLWMFTAFFILFCHIKIHTAFVFYHISFINTFNHILFYCIQDIYGILFYVACFQLMMPHAWQYQVLLIFSSGLYKLLFIFKSHCFVLSLKSFIFICETSKGLETRKLPSLVIF